MSAPTTTPERLERVRQAAMEYVANGWSVVPGSVWNGQRYTQGHAATGAIGLVPVVRSGDPLDVAHEVWRCWTVAPYAVLVRAGVDMDVITVPAGVVATIVEREHPALERCPVVLGPFGARLLVLRGSVLRTELQNRLSVELLTPRTYVPLPPTRLSGGSTRWLREPREFGYQLGEPESVQAAVAEALAYDDVARNRTTSSRGFSR